MKPTSVEYKKAVETLKQKCTECAGHGYLEDKIKGYFTGGIIRCTVCKKFSTDEAACFAVHPWMDRDREDEFRGHGVHGNH